MFYFKILVYKKEASAAHVAIINFYSKTEDLLFHRRLHDPMGEHWLADSVPTEGNTLAQKAISTNTTKGNSQI